MIDLEAVVLWLNGLSPECRISLGGMACHRWGLQTVDVWVFDAWLGQGCLGGPCWCSELATYPSFLKASLVTLRCLAFETHSKNRATVCMLFIAHSLSQQQFLSRWEAILLHIFQWLSLRSALHASASGKRWAHSSASVLPVELPPPQARWNKLCGPSSVFLGIFLESVVLLFACELRHESIFTTTFPSIWLNLTTNPAR